MIVALAHHMKRIARAESGVAVTEFALAFPFMLVVGLMGLEVANRTLVQMQVSQLAAQIADNASRIGEDDVLEDRKIYEADINDLFYGAQLQSTANVDLYAHGRVVLSSLQTVDGTNGQQYIAWQRCMGVKQHTSTYGLEGDGATSPGFPGMGPPGEEVIAFDGEAVMFVEIAYDYQPIIGNPLTFGDRVVTAISSFTVRADRDLTQIYQRDPSAPDPIATCNTFEQSNISIGAAQ